MILVAGGTGFIGAEVVRELKRRDRHDVKVLTSSPKGRAARLAELGVEGVAGSILDPASLSVATGAADVVVQSLTFPTFPVEKPKKGYTFEEFDHHGTERLALAARANGVRRHVYVSGVGAAPNGDYAWHRAKWEGEQALRRSGVGYTILRPSWVYGPEDRALNRFAGFARRLGFVPVIGRGDQRINPLFVTDLARAVADAIDNPEAEGRTLEIGGPEVLTMNEVVATMLSVMGRSRPALHAPAFLPKAAGALLQFLPRPPLSPDAVDFITMDAVADNTELMEVLAPELTPLRVGLSYLGRS